MRRFPDGEAGNRGAVAAEALVSVGRTETIGFAERSREDLGVADGRSKEWMAGSNTRVEDEYPRRVIRRLFDFRKFTRI
jgi:hypothetical protein